MTEDNNIEQTTTTPVTTKQKVVGAVVLVIIVVLIWQVISMFTGGPSQDELKAAQNAPKPFNPVTDQKPQPGKVTDTAPVTAATVPAGQIDQATAIQQQMQLKYEQVISELQMLKLNQQIAETNKEIAAAKFATIKAQKDIIDLLTPKVEPKLNQDGDNQAYVGNTAPGGNPVMMPANNNAVAQVVNETGNAVSVNGPNGTPNSGNNNGGNPQQNRNQPPKPEIANYTAVSVSELLNKWNAVLSYHGKLMSVYVGDTLPADNSKVISIDKSGVTLELQGQVKKISMVPII